MMTDTKILAVETSPKYIAANARIVALYAEIDAARDAKFAARTALDAAISAHDALVYANAGWYVGQPEPALGDPRDHGIRLTVRADEARPSLRDKITDIMDSAPYKQALHNLTAAGWQEILATHNARNERDRHNHEWEQSQLASGKIAPLDGQPYRPRAFVPRPAPARPSRENQPIFAKLAGLMTERRAEMDAARARSAARRVFREAKSTLDDLIDEQHELRDQLNRLCPETSAARRKRLAEAAWNQQEDNLTAAWFCGDGGAAYRAAQAAALPRSHFEKMADGQ